MPKPIELAPGLPARGVCGGTTGRGCGLPILWVKTIAGRLMPLDSYTPLPDAEGHILIDQATTHWATCSARASFQKRR